MGNGGHRIWFVERGLQDFLKGVRRGKIVRENVTTNETAFQATYTWTLYYNVIKTRAG
jgi:hypothetical protein